MIRLITIDNPRLGQAFIDYMALKHIEIVMSPDLEAMFCLWLVKDENLHEAEIELKQFLAHPEDPKYRAASWQTDGKQKPLFRYRSPSVLQLFYAKAGYMTLGVCLLCIVVFVLQVFGLQQTMFNLLHFPTSQTGAWQIWRWVTPAFLHFSILHIIFNLLWWWYLGGDLEKRLGAWKLANLLVLSSAGSGIVQYWSDGPGFGGLSGVVYALVGFIWMIGWKRPELGLSIQKPLLGFMLIWLVIAFVQPFMPIANSAHVAGLLIGMGLGLYEAKRAPANA
ncbi:rhomboid family intramembrane serine protease GlpG [Vibrio gazogenes]|uniref:GlpG protein n=1 Tax=Vibrio gazogenes DSM 21264 = NBRC 103151 TaxID=1123492 RepID=A0A1M5BV79_VIBGA|nr:rhomboid family intramembrane serine protease GlpG [Vibrio gazogenes]USP13642.1 rhomboid family intramembrane serine protease GlpG [Vibrio gazogenes]SHF46310.1 GlpG protein [Vibrio gazogenes DSM 21264] [Vibrio gazogenes DSM 21264 = NBRC 103151]SJN55702.1 Rhomboid protease GlpG [Vibrio gazogenes]